MSEYINKIYKNVLGYKVVLFGNIIDEDCTVFIIQDGDLLDKFENNILKRIKNNMTNFLILFVYPNDRNSEYTPWYSVSDSPFIDEFKGEGDQYLKILLEDICPFILSDINLNPRPGNVYLCGASLGGLISAYGIIEYSHLISGGVLVSPSFWYPDFLEYLDSIKVDLSDKIIYMDIGEDEGKARITNCHDPIQDFKEAVHLLKDKGLEENCHDSILKPDMDHKEVYFLDRIYRGMLFVKRKKIILNIEKNKEK